MSLHSYVDSNTFLHIPSPNTDLEFSSLSAPTVIFFITGNPGLIAYYHDFFSLLTAQHNSTNGVDISQCVVAGFSLAGFEVDDEESGSQRNRRAEKPEMLTQLPFAHNSNDRTHRIYSLHEQIDNTFRRLCVLMDTVQQWLSSSGLRTRPRVVLMGHSVGAYIALEIVRLLHQESSQRPMTETVDAWQPRQDNTSTHDQRHVNGRDSFGIQSCILLTPTILDIAHSPSGRVLTPLLTYIPGLPSLAHLVVYTLTSILSRRWLAQLVSSITKMPNPSSALDTTVAFLLSRNGVRQALAMSHEEMIEIGPNKWREDVWGVMHESISPSKESSTTFLNVVSNTEVTKPDKMSRMITNDTGRSADLKPNDSKTSSTPTPWCPPTLYFLFAHSDHWVADATREEIIAFVNKNSHAAADTEAGLKSKTGLSGHPTVVVEESGKLVHGWCIGQSMQVADRVRGWLEEILSS